MAHVLIVDDARSVRIIVRHIMNREGHEVTEACDGQEGLMVIRTTLHPLVVIMSYAMPIMSGVGAMEIVAADPHLARFHEYIFTSGRNYEESFAQVNTRLPRPASFIQKPFKAAELVTAVNAATAHLAARTQPRSQ